MPTAAEFAAFPDKRLLGATDFDARFFRYLRNESREAIKRLFIQGSFLERMPIAAGGSSRIQISAKPTYGDRIAHDGDGHILDLSQINTTTYFANVNAQVYEIGAAYIEHPKEIRTNPRTGVPEYDRYVEGIGVEATPSSVINNGSTLTFLINPLFEAGTTVANHAGRVVRVYKKVLAAGARTEAIAIETPTVTYDGANNRITTVGLLGQASTAVSTTPSDYVVQLIGLSVLRVQATNRPSVLPAKYFFLGTVTGNGGTPSTFSNTAQAVIRSQEAGQITTTALGAWADGTTNPAGTVQSSLANIVSALTSTANDGRGLGKITSPALPGTPVALAASRAVDQMQYLLDAVNGETRRSERRAENEALQALRLVATSPSGSVRYFSDVAGALSLNGALGRMVAVGNQCCATWEPDTGFVNIANTLPLVSVAHGPSGFVAVGDDSGSTGNAYTLNGSPGSYVWNLSQSTGGRMAAICYSPAANAYVAVGSGRRIFRTVTTGAWTNPVPPIAAGEEINNVASSASVIVALTASGMYLTSTDGTNWTYRGSMSGFYPLARSLQYSPELGFSCLYHTGTGIYIGMAYSTDGIQWFLSGTIDTTAYRLAMAPLDRQYAFVRSMSSTYVSSAFTLTAPDTPNIGGNAVALPLVESGFEAWFVKHIAGQIFVGGRNSGGFGVLYMGGRFRPSYRVPGLSENAP